MRSATSPPAQESLGASEGEERDCHLNGLLTRDQANSRRFALARFLMKYLGEFSMVDPESINAAVLRMAANRRRPESRCRKEAPLKGSFRFKKWPLIGFAAYIYITFKLTLYVWLKICDDCNSFQLAYLAAQRDKLSFQDANWSQSFAGENLNSTRQMLDEKEEKLRGEIDLLRRRLELLGDPYEGMHFFVSGLMTVTLVVTFHVYVATQLSQNYLVKYGFHIVRVVLDERGEAASCRAIIMREVNRLLESSVICSSGELRLMKGIYVEVNQRFRAGKRRLTLAGSVESTERSRNCSFEQLKKFEKLGLSLGEHDRLVGILRHLLRDERTLRPLNLAPEWIDSHVSEFNRGALTNMIYSIFQDVTVYVLIYPIMGYRLALNTPMNFIFIVELLIYIAIGVFATSFHMVLLVSFVNDQIRYMIELRKQLIACIRQNELEFVEMRARMAKRSIRKEGDSSSFEQHMEAKLNNHLAAAAAAAAVAALSGCQLERSIERLNERLVEIFLKYRIFLARLCGIKNAMGAGAAAVLSLTFLEPVLGRLFWPYIVFWVEHTRMAIIIIVLSLSFIGFTNAMVVPMCLLNHNGQKLYIAMWSLLAHCIDLQQQSSFIVGPQREDSKRRLAVYLDQIVMVLRNELANPDMLLAQFEVNLYFFRTTFPSLVKMHFYYGLMMLSLFGDIKSWRQLLGANLDDPLRLMQI